MWSRNRKYEKQARIGEQWRRVGSAADHFVDLSMRASSLAEGPASDDVIGVDCAIDSAQRAANQLVDTFRTYASLTNERTRKAYEAATSSGLLRTTTVEGLRKNLRGYFPFNRTNGGNH